MATIQEIVNYSKANPNSDYAKNAFKLIQSGAFDAQAQKEGYDLTPVGRPAPKQPILKPQAIGAVDLTKPVIDVASNLPKVAKGYTSDLIKGYQEDTQSFKEIAQRADKQSPLSTGLQAAGTAVDAIFRPITTIVSAGTKGIANMVSDNKTLQDIAMSDGVSGVFDAISGAEGKWNEFSAKHPELAKDLEAGVKVAMGVAGEKAAPEVGATLKSEAQAAKGIVGDVTKAVEPIVAKTGEMASKTGETISNIPGAIKEKIPNPLVEKPPRSVETVLKETPTEKFDQYVKIAQDAAVDNKKQTPLEYAGSQAQKALKIIQQQLKGAGKAKGESLNTIGGQTVGDITSKAARDLLGRFEGKYLSSADEKFITDIYTRIKGLGENPTIKQVDGIIDYAQDQLYKAGRDLTVPVTNRIVGPVRTVIGKLNEAVKELGGEAYQGANQKYSDTIKVFQELNEKLGKGGEKGGALMKRVFSPSDANTKALFAKVKELTGIDLVNEATLAKYVMDVLGDARQKSMLEQLNLGIHKPTAGGLLNRLVDYAIEKANSPEAQIRKARNITGGGSDSTGGLPGQSPQSVTPNTPQPVPESNISSPTTIPPTNKESMLDFIRKNNYKSGKVRNPFAKWAPNIHPEDADLMVKFIDSIRLKGQSVAPELKDFEFKGAMRLADKFRVKDKGLASVANAFDDILSGKKKVTGTAASGTTAKSVHFEKNGENLLDIENSNLTLPELRKKLEIAIEGNEDSLIPIIEKDIQARLKKLGR